MLSRTNASRLRFGAKFCAKDLRHGEYVELASQCERL